MIRSDFTFRKKQGKDLGSEDFFQILKFNGRATLIMHYLDIDKIIYLI